MKKLLSGLTIPQQYVCIALEDVQNPLLVFLSTNGTHELKDVTNTHIFVGYRPLVIAIPFNEQEQFIASRDMITMHFVHAESLQNWKNASRPEGCVAKLTLRAIFTKQSDDGCLVFYEGTHGEHKFIRPFHQFVNNQRERWRRNSPGNVSLPGNLHDQVRIAYSAPRIIALITITEGKGLNMFPTDLHGPWGNRFYVSSLRHGGKASEQAERAGNLLLACMPAQQYRSVYALGKNHMQEMKDRSLFATNAGSSRILGNPVPADALYYRELQVIEWFDVGIHRIYFYKVLGEQNLTQGKTLAHVHQYYAQWRLDQGFPLHTFLR